MKRLLLLIAFLLAPSFAYSGDLDNARAYWSVVYAQLGRDTVSATTDTFYSATNQGPVLSAVNSCIRKYAVHLGVYARDTVRVLDQTFVYQLNTTTGQTFIEDGTVAKPIKVYGISSDLGTMYGLVRAETPSQMGNSVTVGPFPSLYDIIDDYLWINTPNRNDVLYVHAPVEGITMTDGADTTNVLPADRNAVCDCATALVADQIGLSTLADKYWDKFINHIIARGGTTPSRGPEVPK